MEKGLKKGQKPSILPTCKEWLKITEWKVIPGMIYVREEKSFEQEHFYRGTF